MKKIAENTQIVIGLLLSLVVIQSIGTIITLLSIPTDPENVFLFGLSTTRFAMVLVSLIIGGVFAYGAVYAFRHQEEMLIFIEKPFFQKYHVWASLPAFVFLTALSWVAFVDLSQHEVYINNIQQSYYTRIYPMALILIVALLSYLLMIVYSNFRQRKEENGSRLTQFFWSIVSFSILLVLWGLVVLTGWGITPQNALWGEAGAVLFGYQTLLVILVATILAVVSVPFQKYAKINFVIDLGLLYSLRWVAKASWIQTYMAHNFFLPRASVANQVRYPYSDAALYDLAAQQILNGRGFEPSAFTTRSIYVFFMAIVHWIAGPEYRDIGYFHVATIALAVPILYLLGKALHSRSAGLMLGGFYVFAEILLIKAAPYIRVVNSKLILTELFAGVLLMVTSYFTFKFLKNHEVGKRLQASAYASSGLLAITSLTRLHSLPIFITVLLLLLIVYKLNIKLWWKPALIYTTVFVTVLAPWAIRNGIVTGKYSIAPGKYDALMNIRWEGETIPEESNQIIRPTLAQSQAEGTRLRLIESPAEATITAGELEPSTFGLIMAHFMHNEVLSILSMPLSYPFETVEGYYENSFVLDAHWAGELSATQTQLLVVNLVILSIGFGYAFKKYGFAGLVPLAFHLTYHAGNALSRTSGWRYLRPVDWVILLYFAIGLAEIISFVLPQIKTPPARLIEPKAPHKHTWMLSGVFVALTVFTSFVPAFIPKRYESVSVETVETKLPQDIWEENQLGFETFLDLRRADILSGMVMYPRYLEADEHLHHRSEHLFYSIKENRIEFTLLDERGQKDILLVIDENIEFFPHGSDAILLVCDMGAYQDVYFIYIVSEEGEASYFGDVSPEKGCQKR